MPRSRGRPHKNSDRRRQLLASGKMYGKVHIPGPLMLEMQTVAAREQLRISELVRQAVAEKLVAEKILGTNVKPATQETDAERAVREFREKVAKITCSPAELKEALRTISEEKERNDPELRKYLDEQRRKSGSARRRALAGRFGP